MIKDSWGHFIYGGGRNHANEIGEPAKELVEHPRILPGGCSRGCMRAEAIATTGDSCTLVHYPCCKETCACGDLTSMSFGGSSFGSSFSTLPRILTPLPRMRGLAIRSISCGIAHTLLLVDEDQNAVYAMGRNDSGQCGISIEQPKVLRLVQVHGLEGQGVVSVVCGGYHSLAATQSGGVFAWGDNTSGQLGIGPLTQQQQQQHPTKRCINTPAMVGSGAFQGSNILPCSISAGRRHSACIDTGGRIMCWGDQSLHQCGVSTSEACVESPKAIELEGGGGLDEAGKTTWRAISCGASFTCALTRGGQVFWWGSVACKLSRGMTASDEASSPRHIPLPNFDAEDLSCGATFCLVSGRHRDSAADIPRSNRAKPPGHRKLLLLRGLRVRSDQSRHRRRSHTAAASQQDKSTRNSFFQPVPLDLPNRMRSSPVCVATPFSHHYLLIFGRGLSEEALTALCMSMHQRLGASSSLGKIQPDILRTIALLAAGRHAG